ncbi:MBG domain-containing protein [Opitutus terrae]|uniref:Cell surface receptor IPT/TIG domain protein n=1 Tax=Opitutus terrae (strain DSM 11246 / JCM 15787 / PB90-1) TaxID=452637 RepID=B1ZP35_OPITP|nr:MBG domain-containing protein [Opitutus terrae]ACB77521.1 cell surface receptor IPT/TIG domain protein [Opitutus terrae PB90-1]
MKNQLSPLGSVLRLFVVCLVLAGPSAWAAKVTSIARQDPGPAITATSATFRVTFDEDVTGVTTGAFTLGTTGTATGVIASVAGSGMNYTVTVDTIGGVGTLRLDFSDGSGLTPVVAGAFAGGQRYLRVPPGTVSYAWGDNSKGQLGNGTGGSMGNKSVVPVAADRSGVLAGKTLVALATSYRHSLALASDGTVYAWGYNANGQLGNGSGGLSTDISKVPVAVDMTGVLAGKTIIAIATGYEHSLALASDGIVYAWGDNSEGQLGDGSTTDSKVPMAVDRTGVLTGKTVVAIAAGRNHSLAVASDGTVYAWGDNYYAQLGDGSLTDSSVPVPVDLTELAGKSVADVAGGDRHSLAQASDGTVYAWGDNTNGQMGDTIAHLKPAPVSVTGGSALAGKTIVAVAAGGYHNLALASDGTVCTWGYNYNGQLGNNSSGAGEKSTVPIAVNSYGALPGKTIVAVGAGVSHSLALASDGALCTWGFNSQGQLGDNSTTNRTVPVTVSAGGLMFQALGTTCDAVYSLALATVPPPTITAVSPSRGLTTGGASVVITGTNFSGASAVMFGSTAATGFTVNSATQITATAPAGSVGTVDVTVTTIGGASAVSAADQFTYILPLTIDSVVAPADATYGAGQELDFTVNFSAAVTVTGTPQLALTMGGVTRYATYVSGDGTTALVFRYTVQSGDGAAGGLTVVSPLQLNGGTIVDAATTAATLTFTPPVTTGVRVATVPLAPTVTAVQAGDGRALVRFTAPASNGGSAITSYTVTSSPDGVTVSGAGVALTITGLTNDTSYTFKVTATNGVGVSAASASSATVTPTRSWSMGFGSSAGDQTYITKTTADAAGNLYVAGYFYGATLEVGQTTLTRIGTRDAFVAKLTPQGSVLWAKNCGGAGGNAYARGIAVDASGHVYVGGYFTASWTTPALTKVGATDAFVMKLDAADGDVLWAQNYGGAGARALGYALAVDPAGDVYLAGCASSAALTLAAGVTLSPIGTTTEDALVLKLAAADGAVQWGRNCGGAGATTNFNGLGVDAAGNVYLGGYFTGADLTTPAIAKLGVYDALVVKLSGDGTFAWAKDYGGAGAVAGMEAVAVTGDGVYVGGYAAGADLTVPVVIRNGDSDALVMKLDPTDGGTVWAKSFGGVGATAEDWALGTDATGNVYAGGFFGGANLTTPALTPIGAQDTLLIKLSASGDVLSAKNYGGAGAEVDIKGIAVDAMNDLYLVGGFSFSDLTTPALPKIGAYDSLLIKEAAPPTPVITNATLSASGTYAAAFAGYTITASESPTSFSATGLPSGLSLNAATGEISGTPTQAGTFNVVLQGTNGNGTGPGSTLVLTMAKAPLSVTANNANRYVGNANPTFTVSYAGFRNGDTAASLTTAPTATTTATVASPAGTYPITPAGGVSGNYTFSYVNGTLTVENEPEPPPPPSKDSQTITFAAPADKLTTDGPFTLSASASSGLTVRFAIASGPATLSGTTVTLTGAPGTVTIRATQPGNSDYEAAPPVERSFTVEAAPPPPIVPPTSGGTASLSVGPSGSGCSYQWQCNGSNLGGATGSTLTLTNVQSANVGLYTYTVSAPDGTVTTSDPVIVGLTTTDKVEGLAEEVLTDVQHPNGNTYDQVLLEGPSATVTTNPNQITRTSFIDLSDDIVQVEFSGAGTLSLLVNGATIPAAPVNYIQPGVDYVRGHAAIVITGANETSNVCVFSVGSVTAVNQALFRSDVTYDGVADIAFIAIQSANGEFGSVRTGNVHYFASQGFTGIYAPGVEFAGPVNIGDVSAFDSASPVLVFGAIAEVRVAGGNLHQPNGQTVKVDGITQIRFTEGRTSHDHVLPAQTNQAVLEQDGVDITDLIVVGP